MIDMNTRGFVLLLVLSEYRINCWCTPLEGKTAFTDDEARDQDIFGPIRDLMSASEAEFMPYGQRRSTSRSHKLTHNHDEREEDSGDYEEEETGPDERENRRENAHDEEEEEDEIEGSEDDDTLRQINQAYRQLEAGFRDEDDDGDFYPDWNKRKRYKGRYRGDGGDYDEEREVVIREEQEDYDEDYGEYDDERTLLDGEADGEGGVVRVKNGVLASDDDGVDADEMSAGEDNGDVHIHLRTLLDNKALKFLWDKVPWDEIIAANRLSRVVEERYITEHVTKKGAEDSGYDHRGYDHNSQLGHDWEDNVYSVKKGREIGVKHIEREPNRKKPRRQRQHGPHRNFPNFRENQFRPNSGYRKRPRFVQQFHHGAGPFPGNHPQHPQIHRRPQHHQFQPQHPNLPHHHHSNDPAAFPIPWQGRGDNRRQRGNNNGAKHNFPNRQGGRRRVVCNKRHGHCREWWRRRRRRRYNRVSRKRHDDDSKSDRRSGAGSTRDGGDGNTTMKRQTWMTKVKTNKMFW